MNLKSYYKNILILVFIFVFKISGQNCTICLNEINQESSIELPCIHSFCINCLDTWITTHYKKTCPNCRFNIGSSINYNLYKEFVKSIKHKDLFDCIKLSKKLYIENVSMPWNNDLIIPAEHLAEIKKDTQNWDNYLNTKLKLIIRHKYWKLSNQFKNQKLYAARLDLIKKIYFDLNETNFIKAKNIRILIGNLLRECCSQLFNKQMLLDAINFFKEDKAYLKIITKKYLSIYG